MSVSAPVRLTSLEIAAGAPFGREALARALPEAEPGLHPREALERAVLPALQRPPCLVAFSGGRDSSAALAIAVRVARRECLPLPVPATMRCSGAKATEETGWQELMVRKLGLADWHRRDIGDELELLGPVARSALRRRGLAYPANSHTLAPLLEDAAPGTLVTGVDGDGLLGHWGSARLSAVLVGAARPQLGDLPRAGLALAPRAVRGRVMAARAPWKAPWLSPDAQAEVTRAWARQRAEEPRRWDRRVESYSRLRYLAAAAPAWADLARWSGARLHHLFLDPVFLASTARAGGWRGFGDRTSAMRFLFAEILPEASIARTTKATFTEVLWREEARRFAAGWDGSGVDPSLVDPEALRREWLAPEPDFRSALALHAAWLGSRAGQREDPVDRGLQ